MQCWSSCRKILHECINASDFTSIIILLNEAFQVTWIKQLAEEQRQNMTAMFNLDGVDLISFLFCDGVFADDGADRSLEILIISNPFASDTWCFICF